MVEKNAIILIGDFQNYMLQLMITVPYSETLIIKKPARVVLEI